VPGPSKPRRQGTSGSRMSLIPTARSLLVACAACAAVLGVPATPAMAAIGPRYLTVMTFNIKHAKLSPTGMAGLAAVIRSAHPDVVGLQEVDRSWSRSGNVDQAAVLAQGLGMKSFFQPNLNCVSADLSGDGFCQYGNAILSRYPFVGASFRLYSLPTVPRAEPRGLARVAINVGGRIVDLFNAHLTYINSLRPRQVEFIRNLVRHDRRPFVVTGDFNARPFFPEMVRLRQVVRDAPSAAGRPALRTFAVGTPVRFDYVLLPRPPLDGPPQRVLALSARVVYVPQVSDHRPLIARIRIPPTGGRTAR
jgi:endonuclease/exonuclease/phosphatase family metal-dependent hydrolase